MYIICILCLVDSDSYMSSGHIGPQKIWKYSHTQTQHNKKMGIWVSDTPLWSFPVWSNCSAAIYILYDLWIVFIYFLSYSRKWNCWVIGYGIAGSYNIELSVFIMPNSVSKWLCQFPLPPAASKRNFLFRSCIMKCRWKAKVCIIVFTPYYWKLLRKGFIISFCICF